ncbi:MAG TPA: UDP-N-acetylmuramoyl-L-alanyl-D-glutamate--2,6-diaminopimelate ligase [Actinomycetota bacterium]|nr:UDP-N-acetylmuramoyl-L-alanyl-D-glutamate--2,6-diaminopimelate ligase [Actinomycetota bacterium]
MDWTLRSLLDASGTDASLTGDAPVAGISYDTRRVAPGDLFCCIRGAKVDGHDLIPEALGAGAAALLVDRDVDASAPMARVGAVRRAMGHVAAAFFGRPSERLAVAGVTGTNGKTTTSYLIDAMATAAGRRTGLIGTVETRVAGAGTPAVRTTPESVDLQRLFADMLSSGCEVVSMEVASHGLDQRRVGGTRFAAAGFTNLTQDHLDYHGTMEEYYLAKASLFTREYTPIAVVNTDDPYGQRLAGEIDGPDLITYGSRGEVTWRDLQASRTGTSFDLVTPAGEVRVETHLVGHYNLHNICCAAAIAAVGLGLDLEAVAAGAANVLVPGRLEPVDAGQGFAVLVDYAHTPDAVANVLQAVRGLSDGRVIVVLGCGGDRDRAKRPLMGRMATELADLAVLTSDNPRSEDPDAILDEVEAGATGPFVRVTDRRAAIAEALAAARPGDVVVIAGKGHETGQQFADRTLPFDDRIVARELLEELGCRA